MKYRVRVESIARDISDEVKAAILNFLPSYYFPYSTTVTDKEALQRIFIEHFQERHSLDWLKGMIEKLSHNPRGASATAWCETSRLHTKGLGTVLLAQGQAKCVTIHTYGNTPMSQACRDNLEGKILDIKEVIANSFPENVEDLNRTDIPMIPQHFNCRHVMAPIE